MVRAERLPCLLTHDRLARTRQAVQDKTGHDFAARALNFVRVPVQDVFPHLLIRNELFEVLQHKVAVGGGVERNLLDGPAGPEVEAPFRARLATGREHLDAPVLPAVRVTQPPLEEVFFLILCLLLSSRLHGVRMQVLERYGSSSCSVQLPDSFVVARPLNLSHRPGRQHYSVRRFEILLLTSVHPPLLLFCFSRRSQVFEVDRVKFKLARWDTAQVQGVAPGLDDEAAVWTELN